MVVKDFTVLPFFHTDKKKIQCAKMVAHSVRPKPCFGIGNRNQDQVSVSVSGPELFLPKPKLSPILKIYQKIILVMT